MTAKVASIRLASPWDRALAAAFSPAQMECPRSESPFTYMPALSGELILGPYAN
jgi:hypothetical protein